jgi:hypothetical protein
MECGAQPRAPLICSFWLLEQPYNLFWNKLIHCSLAVKIRPPVILRSCQLAPLRLSEAQRHKTCADVTDNPVRTSRMTHAAQLGHGYHAGPHGPTSLKPALAFPQPLACKQGSPPVPPRCRPPARGRRRQHVSWSYAPPAVGRGAIMMTSSKRCNLCRPAARGAAGRASHPAWAVKLYCQVQLDCPD